MWHYKKVDYSYKKLLLRIMCPPNSVHGCISYKSMVYWLHYYIMVTAKDIVLCLFDIWFVMAMHEPASTSCCFVRQQRPTMYGPTTKQTKK